MRSSLRKPLWVLMSLITIISMLTACQSAPSASTATSAPVQSAATATPAETTAATAAAPNADALAPATLKIILFADKKVDTDYIWGKVGEYTKDKLNATFTTTWIPAADYTAKLLAMAASGDN